jgi:hypothetical protein
MSTQPFGQQSAFGAPAPTSSEPAFEEPAKKSGKTVVIAVAAGVVALGVLGGAAALVLTSGGDTAESALPPAPVASTEPSVAPTTEPAKPLPTAAVQGRNVFLPLVEEDDAAAAGEGDTVADPQPAVATTAPTTAPTVAPLPLPAPTVTVTASDDELVAGLRAQIATLEALLADLDGAAANEIAALQAEIAALQAELEDAEGGSAYDATVRLVGVNPDADGALLSLVVNGEDVKLDLDAGDPTFEDSTVIHTTETDVDISLTYVDYVSATKIVTFTIGSESFQATLGTTLVYNF